ncbi:DUF2974 domain-containing protein [bacterium]|nr:DUF2974 domain-containing protein [bacterium]
MGFFGAAGKWINNNIIEPVVDYGKGKIEDVVNIGHSAEEFVFDSCDVVGAVFTGGDVKGEWDDLWGNAKDNAIDILTDHYANTLNNQSNVVRSGSNFIQLFVDGADALWKPNEDNFKGVDSFLNKTEEVTDLVSSGHDNIDALKSFFGNAFDVIGPQLTKENITEAIAEAKKSDGIINQFKAFNMSLLQNAAIDAVNDAIQSKPTGKISDSEISNTQEFNGLTNKEMLLLNNLSYSGFANIDNKGKTLGEVSNEIKEKVKTIGKETGAKNLFDENGNVTPEGIKALAEYDGETKDLKYKIGTTDYETFANILNDISNKEELSSLTILDNTDIPENGINATTYGRLDENGKLIGNPTVVFQGTIGSAGWQDNAKSLNETNTQMQQAAYEYIERQGHILKDYSNNPDDIHLTVSGHSKGGNLAMYSTIENSKDESSNLTIDNCLSFDGEGFNNEYVEQNKEAIEENKSKITSINAYVDPVNLLLNDISGQTYFVGVDYTKLETDKNGNAVINELGDFQDFVWDAHSPQSMYREVNNSENGDWTLYEKCEIASAIDGVSNDVESMTEPIKSFMVDMLVEMFEPDQPKEEPKQTSPELGLGQYNLTIVRTEKGYNICDKESGNIVAKYDHYGELISGCTGQYANGADEQLDKVIDSTIKNMEKKYS